ncbi:AraC family transcriptional regulator ligand-binding domain-containing protein [Sorangium sp. So ce1097]|uniref:AraC family transcriptional regulator ligand-binding domain-containing protein n=1 Tax=Sorangium sp. So ce1097 TaxID=3133330 RepID=UPI003F624C68
MRPTGCIKAIRLCVLTASRAGVDPREALAVAEVDPALLEDPTARVPHDTVARAWTRIPELARDPAFGLHAAELLVGQLFDVVDFVTAQCATVRAGGDRLRAALPAPHPRRRGRAAHGGRRARPHLAALRRRRRAAPALELHPGPVLAPIAPEELARAVRDPALREQLVNGLCAMTLCGERIDDRDLLEVERFAAALGARPDAVRQLHRLHERLVLLRIDIARNALLGKSVRRMLDEGGVYGLARNLASFAGVLENEPVAARYRSLEGYREGTLGKALFTFYRENGFSFPGERRGVPEGVLTHDLSHILAGYGTDLHGEAMTIAFQAGYRRENPFGILVFLLVQLQQGVQLTVLAPAQQGMLATPGLADDLVRSFVRGTKMNTDLMDDWDFWSVMAVDVEELRRRYGVLPAAAAA